MVKLFISYRRSDSEGYAGRLFDQLTHTFPPSDVFMDVDSIAPGENFVDVLDKNIAQTDVMLVVIGPHWLTASDESGQRRIDHPQDFVRHEIAEALKRNIGVIPILIGPATMPEATALPDDLSELARKQAVWLRHNSFSSDVERLVKAINKQAQRPKHRSLMDFGAAIAEEYNEYFVISGGGSDFKLQLFFGSESSIPSYFRSHMLKDALVYLIEEADIGGWMKYKEELEPHEFWAAILKAVATSYRSESPFPTDDESDGDLLRQLLSELEEEDNL